MKAIMLAATTAMLVGITPAQAAVVTMGAGYAQTCYRAAEARVISRNALNACDQALTEEALVPYDRAGTHVNRGILKLLGRNYDAAIRDFDTALALDPNQPEAWLNKAIAEMNAGKSAAALPLVDKAIQLKTSKPHFAYYVRGLAHEDTGNVRAAYTDLKRAQALAPKWREPSVELARYQVRAR